MTAEQALAGIGLERGKTEVVHGVATDDEIHGVAAEIADAVEEHNGTGWFGRVHWWHQSTIDPPVGWFQSRGEGFEHGIKKGPLPRERPCMLLHLSDRTDSGPA